jgi:hypothetical protein
MLAKLKSNDDISMKHFCLFVYLPITFSLFNDAAISSDYTVLNAGTISESCF